MVQIFINYPWKSHNFTCDLISPSTPFQANNILTNETTGLPILQFVSIKREDTGEFAIPGGMCDPGENVSQSLKREFGEEALNTDAFPERLVPTDEI